MIFEKVYKSKLNCVIAIALILTLGSSLLLVFIPYEDKISPNTHFLK